MSTFNTELNTKISFIVRKNKEVIHNAHIWVCGKMSQDDINKIDDNEHYMNIINKFFDSVDYDITEVIFSTGKKDDEKFDTIIVDSSIILDDKKLSTRANLKVKRVDFNGDHIIKYIHIWFPKKIDKKAIEDHIFGYHLRNRINNYFGSTDYELINFTHEEKPENVETYEIFIDKHETIKREDVKKETIELEEMSIQDLMNLKDRIEEIIFKKENNLTDDEYEFFLENEEHVKIEDVKEMFKLFQKDKFKFKKIKIRQKLELT